MGESNKSIYILRLEGGKFYVGSSKNALNRISDHLLGNGAAYTKKYKPVEIEEVIHNCDGFDEDKYVMKYMSKYGINNVRGGSYCSFILDKNVIKDIEMRIGTAAGICFICSSNKHFAKDCPTKQKLDPSDQDICVDCKSSNCSCNDTCGKSEPNSASNTKSKRTTKTLKYKQPGKSATKNSYTALEITQIDKPPEKNLKGLYAYYYQDNILVCGNKTYEARFKLRSLKGQFNKELSCWILPKNKEEDIINLLENYIANSPN